MDLGTGEWELQGSGSCKGAADVANGSCRGVKAVWECKPQGIGSHRAAEHMGIGTYRGFVRVRDLLEQGIY